MVYGIVSCSIMVYGIILCSIVWCIVECGIVNVHIPSNIDNHSNCSHLNSLSVNECVGLK